MTRKRTRRKRGRLLKCGAHPIGEERLMVELNDELEMRRIHQEVGLPPVGTWQRVRQPGVSVEWTDGDPHRKIVVTCTCSARWSMTEAELRAKMAEVPGDLVTGRDVGRRVEP